jgi:AAA+ ATPase superfamily predicted ATPase
MVPLSPFRECIKGALVEDIFKVVKGFRYNVSKGFRLGVSGVSFGEALGDGLEGPDEVIGVFGMYMSDKDAVIVFDLYIGVVVISIVAFDVFVVIFAELWTCFVIYVGLAELGVYRSLCAFLRVLPLCSRVGVLVFDFFDKDGEASLAASSNLG